MLMKPPQRLLWEGMLQSAELHPKKTALIIEGESFTYERLADGARRVAAALVQYGVKRGDRVALFMDNTWTCVLSIYGVLLAGGVFVVLNPQTKHDKLQSIINDSDAAVLITDSRLKNVFISVVHNTPSLRSVISSGNSDGIAEKLDINLVSFTELLANTDPIREPVFTIPCDLAALIYTSGSTGSPKGVMQTHQAMVFALWSLIEYLRLSEQEKIMLFLPMAFDYGLYQLLMAMALGATLIVERSFTFPALIYSRISEYQATVFPGVPTVFSMLLASHRKMPISFPSITRVTNTAAALSSEFIPALKEIFPNALIFKMYGLTECKRVCYLEPELLDSKTASVGKAIPGTETFLLSLDGQPVEEGNPGILHVRGPHVMAGYWRKPELTQKMLKQGKIPGERFLCTHDWFRYDEEGYLYFIGRSDDIIKTRGEKVSPAEVENILYGIPGIKDAAVIGVPDATFGQAVKAFVVLDNSADLTERKIMKICLSRLENFMVPQQVVILDEMPKTANEKMDKRKLMELGD